MNIKEDYRKFCSKNEELPLFFQDWWLDAAAGESNWDVVAVKSGDAFIAAMPYTIKRRWGVNHLGQPPLTPWLGPWISPSSAKRAACYSKSMEVMTQLIEQLPTFFSFSQNWHYSQTNWLPFYYRNFEQTTRYTYLLPLDVPDSVIWAGFRENIRTDIRKASSRFQLVVRDDCNIETFLKLNRMVFQRKGIDPAQSADLVRRIDSACQTHHCRKILVAEDEKGRAHAGCYLVWDKNCVYYLMGGSDADLRNSGAVSFCLYEAIKFALTIAKHFDFEGSMIEPVERCFRAFGGVQTPYFRISRNIPKAFARKAGKSILQFIA